MIAPARSSWRCLKGHTDGPKASWSRVCVSCLYLALRPCIVRRVSRARGRGVPWTDGEEELKTWGGAGRRAGAGGGARGFFTFVSAEPRDILYNSSAQPRLTRAVQQTPLAPFHSYQLPPRTGGIRASPGCGESGLGESSHELRRPHPSKCRERQRGRRPAHVGVVRVWTVCAVARTTLHSRLSRVSLSLSVSRRA